MNHNIAHAENILSPAPPSDPVTIVCAADEAFRIPLACMLKSLWQHFDSDRRLSLYVIDGGLSENTMRDVESIVESSPGRAKVRFIKPDLQSLKGFDCSGHVSIAAYFRLLIPTLLPDDVDQVLYLDSDLVICRDVCGIWDQGVAGHYCLAIQDQAAPYIDSAISLAHKASVLSRLSAITPVMNYRELELNPRGKYFNSGVLLINLARWRKDNVTHKLLECLRTQAEHVLWWDQYALNVVLAGKWGELDLRWNQGSAVFTYPGWRSSPFSRTQFLQLQENPWIIHYSSPIKPWHQKCDHPFRDEFFRVLDETNWKGWRPEGYTPNPLPKRRKQSLHSLISRFTDWLSLGT